MAPSSRNTAIEFHICQAQSPSRPKVNIRMHRGPAVMDFTGSSSCPELLHKERFRAELPRAARKCDVHTDMHVRPVSAYRYAPTRPAEVAGRVPPGGSFRGSRRSE